MSFKTVVIHQPDFAPYLGFFDRLLVAEKFIILDHVMLSKSGWVHRDQIKTSRGADWISLPVKKLSSSPIINEAQIQIDNKFEKIVRVIDANYRSARYYDDIFPEISSWFQNPVSSLYDFNTRILMKFLEWFDIDVEIYKSSDLGVVTRKSDMNAELVDLVGGDIYLSGVGARNYHVQEPFDDRNIQVYWQDFKHPIYPQLGEDFIPYLSAIDLILNVGVEKARDILRKSR